MIVVKAFRILYDASKNPVLYNPKVVASWSLKTVEGFDFDITSPKEWKTFLASYKTKNGKLLPNSSPAGDDIVYHVYSWGMLPPNYEGVFASRRATSFFPGYDKEGNRRDIKIYGRIR